LCKGAVDLRNLETGTLIRLALYMALGLTLNILETHLIPLGLVLPLPGARIGLANLVTVVVLCTESPGFLWAVILGRIFLASLLTGTFLALPFALSLGGGVAALLVMGGVRRLAPGLFSPVGLSILGAAAHNCGQLLLLHLLLPGTGVFAFLPWLLLLAIPAGWLNGFLAVKIIKRLPGVYDPYAGT